MKLRDAARLAIMSMGGSLMRTLLTILGLSVGVGAVLTVLALGSAGEDRVEREIAKLGVDKVWIHTRDKEHSLTGADSQRLFSATEAPACAASYTAAPVRLSEHAVLAQIAGFDQSMQQVHALVLRKGRGFTQAEIEQGSPVCLIDEALAQQLHIEEPGDRLTSANRRLRVVGIIKGMTMQIMSGGNGLMILPLKTFLETFGGDVSEITLAVQRGQSADAVAEQALTVLSSDEGFRADTLEKEITAAREIVRIFIAVLLCVAAVCMVTGGIGVMNVLLISVRERRREIGLIKAIGGTGVQIALLFLLEAAAYALLGGLVGTVLGGVMTEVFGRLIGLTAEVSVSALIPVLLGATLLGLAFGVGPAIRAAGMEPVDALRSE